jgi:flagellar protein FliL
MAITPAPAPPETAPVEDAEVPVEAKKSSRLVLAIVGAVALAGLGGGAWFVMPRLFAKASAHAEAPAEIPVKAVAPVGPVVVNLAGEARRYVKVSVELGVAGPKDVKEIEEHRSRVLDLVITVLSEKDAATLTSSEGRAALKDELLDRIHEELGLERVARVYFTEFMIQ